MIINEIPLPLAPLLSAVQDGDAVIAVDCAFLLGPDGAFPIAGLRHVSLADLGQCLLTNAKPNCVVAPLFAARTDATTVIELLEDLGYAGRIAILAPQMPDPWLVEAELRAMGPGARLVLISP